MRNQLVSEKQQKLVTRYFENWMKRMKNES